MLHIFISQYVLLLDFQRQGAHFKDSVFADLGGNGSHEGVIISEQGWIYSNIKAAHHEPSLKIAFIDGHL